VGKVWGQDGAIALTGVSRVSHSSDSRAFIAPGKGKARSSPDSVLPCAMAAL
jgi:hypothetical protein